MFYRRNHKILLGNESYEQSSLAVQQRQFTATGVVEEVVLTVEGEILVEKAILGGGRGDFG